MQFTNPFRENRLWVFLISSAFFISTSVSDHDRIQVAGLCCENVSRRSIEPGSYSNNFAQVVDGILPEMSDRRRGAYAVTQPAPPVYGLAQCYGHVTGVHCQHCFFRAKSMVSVCLPRGGRIFLDGCYFRYAGYDFFGESLDADVDISKCSAVDVGNSSLPSFRQMVEQLVGKVAKDAYNGDGFGSGSNTDRSVSIFAMAQCWTSLSVEGCKKCLSEAAKKVTTCPPATEARAMLAGCFLRYSSNNFLDTKLSSAANQEQPTKKPHSRLCLTTFLLAFVFFIVVSITGCYVHTLLAQKRGSCKVNSVSVAYTDMNLNYEILEKATNSFSESNKLGQGGAGSVFKGVLPDGRTVAVKKLVFNTRTRQWADEFFNEVNLIKGIHHNNLIGLLGCSIEGPESLLVYEYVPNRSLDQFLFMRNTVHILSWKQRFEIILGTAEGLAFLHGGSGVKIIHRDIKTSNILLDQNLTAKIADFGLARSVDPSKSHLSTGIAGTLGYLAPEYLVRGQLTEKADVYAFGVVVIEISSGRKNNAFSSSDSILHNVWKHYISRRLPDCVDPGLRNRFPLREASNVLQIGLLCTQSCTQARPSMEEVVRMLKDEHCVIPSPKQPPFLNASFLSPEDTDESVIGFDCEPPGHA